MRISRFTGRARFAGVLLYLFQVRYRKNLMSWLMGTKTPTANKTATRANTAAIAIVIKMYKSWTGWPTRNAEFPSAHMALRSGHWRVAESVPNAHLHNWHRPHASLDLVPPGSRSGLESNNPLSEHGQSCCINSLPGELPCDRRVSSSYALA